MLEGEREGERGKGREREGERSESLKLAFASLGTPMESPVCRNCGATMQCSWSRGGALCLSQQVHPLYSSCGCVDLLKWHAPNPSLVCDSERILRKRAFRL